VNNRLGPSIGGGQHCEPIEHTHEDKHRIIAEIAEIIHRYWAPERKKREDEK
jgi:hypothetical protein